MIYTIHGYNTDPYSKDPNHRPTGQQCEFAVALDPFLTRPFNWYSSVQYTDFLRCLGAGHLNTYAWAYKKLSLKAAADFLDMVRRSNEPVDVFAHSLGSRVVLEAARRAPKLFNRICLINAAECSDIASGIIQRLPTVKILNVCVEGDNILDKAAGYMSPGWFKKENILGQDGLLPSMQEICKANYREVFLDDPVMQTWMHDKYGLDLKGGGDHHTSYKHEGNHGLYWRFFNDELEF